MGRTVDGDGTYAVEKWHSLDFTDLPDDSAEFDADAQAILPTLLIVDDDDMARLALSSILDNGAYRIVDACSADEACERLHLIQPDVILCDLIMHGMNGDEFCRRLKSHYSWKYVPVIAITRVDNSVAVAGVLDAGADDVVVKPVKARELRARVAAAVRTRGRYLDLVKREVERSSRMAEPLP